MKQNRKQKEKNQNKKKKRKAAAGPTREPGNSPAADPQPSVFSFLLTLTGGPPCQASSTPSRFFFTGNAGDYSLHYLAN
jgi:hypothetical protein